MNTLQNEMPQTSKITIGVIDVGFQMHGYSAWLQKRTHGHIQVASRGCSTEKAAATELLQQKPDCVLYNPWGAFMPDPAQALVSREWGEYTGMCYGVDYLGTIQQLSPDSKVLICTEDFDRDFVFERGQRFKNFSGYVHYSVKDLINVIARTMEGDLIADSVPDYYFPKSEQVESFESLCEQTDLLALAEHQRRSPKHIYYSVLLTMECMKVQSFAKYRETILGMIAIKEHNRCYQFFM